MKKTILFGRNAILLFALTLAISAGTVLAQKQTKVYESGGLKMTVSLDYAEREKDGKKWRENCQIIVQAKNTTSDYLFSRWSTSIAFKVKETDSASRSEQSAVKEELWLYPGETKTRSLSGCYLEGYTAGVDKKEKVDPKTWKKVNE